MVNSYFYTLVCIDSKAQTGFRYTFSYRNGFTLKIDFHIEYKCKYASLNYYYKLCFHVYRCLLNINNTLTTSIAVYFFSSKFSRRLLCGFRVGFIRKFEIRYYECSHLPSLEIKHIECV